MQNRTEWQPIPTMSYFTVFNTEGFTESQLDQLNVQFENEMKDCEYEAGTIEREYFEQKLSEQLLNKY